MTDLVVAIRAMVVFTALTGVLYPLTVTLLGKTLFPGKVNGSLVDTGTGVLGSELIAQPFTSDKYFWPRPSAVKYDPTSSGASNLSVTSADLMQQIRERETHGAVADMRFASGSGLDPHISVEAARSQLARVAKARQVNPTELARIVDEKTQKRQFGFLGEDRVNVLLLNLELDNHFRR